MRMRRFILVLGILSAVAGSRSFAQGVITTIAGNGITQYIGDGWPATSYSLAEPKGICVDHNGTIYVADHADNRIRKLAHDSLFTIAGNGTPANAGDGGPCSAAQFGNPFGMCMDGAENFFIADEYFGTIRRIDHASSIISTICGTGTSGYSGDGGMATAAQLTTPKGLCTDTHGNVIVADYGNNRVRKIDIATGIITTIAGNGASGYSGDNGPGTAAKLSFPMAVSADSNDNIYIADYGNNRIRKVDAATGVITTVVGTGTAGSSGDGGLAVNATLRNPNGLYMSPHGRLYISDGGNNVVRIVYANGTIQTVAGNGGYGFTGDNGPALSATFNTPSALYVDDSEYLYIADGGNSAIRKVTPSFVGISYVATDQSFRIYPNPSNGSFTITGDNISSDVRVQVYNSVGRLVATGTVCKWDLSAEPAGIYFINIIGQGFARTVKLVISR